MSGVREMLGMQPGEAALARNEPKARMELP